MMSVKNRPQAAPTVDQTSIVRPSASPTTYVLPTAGLMLGAMLLIVSTFLPYWTLTLYAPQYPDGLEVTLFVNRLDGDVEEIDLLNHYIGMRELDDAAQFERSFAVIAVATLAMLLLAAVFVQNRWAGLLALPAVLYPAVFLADLFYWLYRYGHDLNPKAPLSTSIKPFTPTILGAGHIGQFRTIAQLEEGFFLAAVGSLVVLASLYAHRRAYKPLVEARQRARSA